ncbi:MAG: hypothetical protein ACE5G0_23280, partial [Rhodothermales bacterium]
MADAMNAGRVYLIVMLVLSLTLLACASRTELPDPDTLPYIFEQVRDFDRGNLLFADIDGDQVDEILAWDNIDDPGLQRAYVHLMRQDGSTIEQINFAGIVKPPHILEDDAYDRWKMLVPHVRNDSLFVSFLDKEGNSAPELFMAEGVPKQEGSGVIPWDPNVEYVNIADVDRDGRKELVTFVRTGFARLPRGVFVHTLPDLQLVGKEIIANPLSSGFMDDFDGDGRLELIIGTTAPSNGTVVDPFDDKYAYVIRFDFYPEPKAVKLDEMSEDWSHVLLFYEDFDGDGSREFLVFNGGDLPDSSKKRLQLVEPKTWTVKRTGPGNAPFNSPLVVDLNRDARPEILVMHRPGYIWVFNQDLDRIREREIAPQLTGLNTLPDVDGDGVDELLAFRPEGSLLLGPHLNVKAVFPGGLLLGIVRRGAGVPPYLRATYNERTVWLRLVQNRLYLVYRYGPVGLQVLGVALILLV